MYPRPRPGETEYYGCLEWNEGQTEHYEVSMEYGIHNDCLPKQGGDHARVSRAVFEFPLHSNRYLSLYNTHQEIPPCDIPDSILYIRDRQETFRDDLEGYLLDDRRARKPFWIYPPIFAGDMNTRGPGYTNTDEWMDECNITDEGERQEIEALLSSFVDAPGAGPIDKVWVGKPDDWTHDVRLEIVEPPQPPDISWETCHLTQYPPFSCAPSGYYMTGTDNAYTDHSPSMVEVEAIHD